MYQICSDFDENLIGNSTLSDSLTFFPGQFLKSKNTEQTSQNAEKYQIYQLVNANIVELSYTERITLLICVS